MTHTDGDLDDIATFTRTTPSLKIITIMASSVAMSMASRLFTITIGGKAGD